MQSLQCEPADEEEPTVYGPILTALETFEPRPVECFLSIPSKMDGLLYGILNNQRLQSKNGMHTSR